MHESGSVLCAKLWPDHGMTDRMFVSLQDWLSRLKVQCRRGVTKKDIIIWESKRFCLHLFLLFSLGMLFPHWGLGLDVLRNQDASKFSSRSMKFPCSLVKIVSVSLAPTCQPSPNLPLKSTSIASLGQGCYWICVLCAWHTRIAYLLKFTHLEASNQNFS